MEQTGKNIALRKNIVQEMTNANKKHLTLNSKVIQGNCSFMEDRYDRILADLLQTNFIYS
jgi:hypothetical protein